MSQPFDLVSEQLLREGIALRHVRRYLSELSEHLADLTAKEIAAGHSAGDAAIRARAALGTDAELVRAMLARPQFLAFSVRAPWAVFGIAPVLLVFLAVVAVTLGLAAMLFPYIVSQVPASDIPLPLRALVTMTAASANFLIGPIAAALMVWLAVRQRISSFWPLFGVLVIAVTGALFTLIVQFPVTAGEHGELNVDFAPFLFGHATDGASSMAFTLLRIVLAAAPAYFLYRTARVRLMPKFV